VDVRAVAFALSVAVLVGILFGLIPALALGDSNVATRLRASRSTPRQRHRLQAGLVVAQVTLATVLLAGGVLLGRTMLHLDRVDPGFAPDPLLGVIVEPPFYRFRNDDGGFASQAHAAYLQRLEDALAAVPGIDAVAMTSVIPFSSPDSRSHIIEPEGYDVAPGEMFVAEAAYVSGNYLDVIGARPIEGRLLTAADDRADAAPVIVVSRRLADRFWPSESALGERVMIPGPGNPQYTIVGVVDDMHDRTLEADSDLRYYAPRAVAGPTSGSFVLRVRGDPTALTNAVRERIAAFDEDLPVTRITPMRDMMQATLAEQRYRARLLLCFAVLALFFATAGIYGAMNRRVALRRHEIGVRMALGARRTGVLARVLREGVGLASGGIVLGSAIALAGSRVVEAWLSGVSPTDPLTYATIAAILAGAAVLAALAPSLRAARVDPMVSLRSD
jgi:predicted permease